MDSSPTAQSPDLAEPVPAFRRPANDTSRRHYRRHSPSSSRSPSPASPGGWKRDRSQSPSNSQDLHGGSKALYAAKKGRKEEAEKEAGREEGSRSRRDTGSLDHRSQGQSRDHYEKNDEYSHSRRHSSHHDRYYHSHYNSGRDSYRDSRSEYSRREGFGRPTRVDERSPDRTRKDRGDNESRDKTKEWNTEREKERNSDRDRYRDRDREFGPERGKIGVRRSDADTEENVEKSRDSAMGREKRERSRDQEKDKGKEKDYDRYRDREEQQERDRHKEKDELRERDRCKDRHDYKESERQRQKEGFRESSRSKDKDENKDRDRLKEDPKYQDAHRGRGDYEQGPRKSSHHHDVTKDGGKLSLVKDRDVEHSRDKNWSVVDVGGDKTSSGDKRYDDSSTHEKEKAPHKSSVGPDRIEKEKRHPHEVLKGSDVGGSFKTDVRRHYSSDGDLKRIDDPVRDKQVSPEVGATGNHVDSMSGQVNTSLASPDERLEKGSKWGPEAHTSSEASCIAPSEAEVSNDLDFAKMAAMRAAELVNKNLGAGGFMSTDQKKRLLWGSKKKTADQEVVAAAGTNRWDTVRFADRDRQEKFNKLMGVKGDFKGDEKIQEKDAGLFTAEKQQELQQELEKQFTAGLRRRDGRTVGLGL